jgi:ABC-type transport system involved in multi-copper enzyme maturation permease subunit
MLIALAAAISIVVLLRWPTDGVVDALGTRSQQVFRVFGYVLLIGVMFLVPAFPATSIVRERNRGTLALLLNSPLTPWSIFWGKVGGTLLFAVLLLISSLPAAGACYAMGGIDPVRQILLLYAVMLAAALQYTSLGLFVSSHVRSTDAGVRITYALVFAMGILALGPYYLMQGREGWGIEVARWLRSLSPLPITMQIVGDSGMGVQGIVSRVAGPREFFILSGLTIVVFSVATIARLNYRLFERSRPQGRITDDRSFAVRSSRRLMYLIDPQRRKAGIPWFVNPVTVKEFRSRRFGRTHWMLRLIAICAVTSLLLTWAAATGVTNWGIHTIGGLMVLLQLTLLLLITPSLAAGMISGERENGGWELLRMTPLSAFKILRGKLLSVSWTLVLILLATLPGYIVMIYIEPALWLQVQVVLVCLAIAALYALLLSAAVGSLFARTAAATTSAYAVVLVAFLGPLLIWMGRDAPFGQQVVQSALSTNTIGAALMAVNTPGFAEYELLPGSWWISGVACCLALLLLFCQLWKLTRPG